MPSIATTDETKERISTARATDAARSEAQTAARIAVSVSHLSKTYAPPLMRLKHFLRRPTKPPVQALRDVTFDIHAGEIFGLIGRNGAGKTTLTKIIATLVQPTSGTVSVNGYDSVRDEQEVRRRIGLATAEERSFYWRLTAEQNLLFFARLYGLSDRFARVRIAELFAQLEFEDLARRRFGELSTGNKQRLSVARALLASPPVLLLDEPTRSLDPLAAASLRSLIASLARQQPPVSILLTSHNLAEVEELCRRVAVIGGGKIRALDTPENLRAPNQRTARIRLTVRVALHENLQHAFAGQFDSLETTPQGESIIFSFLCETGDDQLDKALRIVHKHGGRVINLETERATLLDVLESYAHEEEGAQRKVAS
ncbi:MAG: ABC transporter ATP-binding protein [Pyrinomonadaceae bacterium]